MAELPKTDYQGVTTHILFDDKGDIKDAAVTLYQAKDGQWAALKGVYPFEEINQLPALAKLAGVDRLVVPGVEAERHLVRLLPC